MRYLFLWTVFLMQCFSLGHAAENYLLSSEPLTQGNRSSLKGYTSFVFNALLQTDGKRLIPSWMEKKLREVAILQKDSVLTPQGLDFNKMPRNFLTFSVEQLIDLNNALLPIMRVKLITSSFVKIENNQESRLLDTNEWSIYIKKEELNQNVPKAFSELLNKFLKDYQTDNKEKPTFYIL